MADDNERQKNFEKLKKFLNSDFSIKNSLVELAPNEMDNYNEDSRIQYVDKLYKELNDMEYEFTNMCKNFSKDDEIVKKKFAQIRENLIEFNYSSGDINTLYQKNFSDMDNKLVEDVKHGLVGYLVLIDESFLKLVENSKSINELLHVFHSYIMNNDEFMQSMPIIESKNNNFGCEAVLYGEETELSRNIFESFPNDIDVGRYTDIISMKDKTFMMVRDRGHALTIEIDEGKDSDQVNYFVPKLCNREMVEKLPGIGKITKNGARGTFEASKDELTQKLYDFIEKVPTDADIPEIQEWYEEKYNVQDVKDMVMEVGENGRKRSNIEKLQSKMKEALDIVKQKLKNIFSKDKGEDSDDELSRDE